MKRIILYCGLLVMFGIAVVYILKLSAKKVVDLKNGFNRDFKEVVDTFSKVDLQYNTFYIAGVKEDRMYFGNFLSTNHLLISDLLFKDTLHLSLKVPGIEKTFWKLLRINIDSLNLYMIEGRTPSFYVSRLSNLHLDKVKMKEKTFFLGATPLSPNSVIVNFFDKEQKQNNLGKIFLATDSVVKSRLLKIQEDDLLRNTGKLIYNAGSDKMVYLYRYCNEFMCIDTNLNLVYKGKTIDTITESKFAVAKYTERSRRMASPPKIVNKIGSIDENLLFVCSGLKADNEKDLEFDESLPVDVYSLPTGEYISSFYIKKENRGLINDFKVYKGRLYIILDRYMYIYNLDYSRILSDKRINI